MIGFYTNVNKTDYAGFYDIFLNVWNLLYVRRDVILCPFLPECEEVVEALQRVLREILHSQQADGLRAGGVVHQGDALEHLQCQFLRRSQ